MLKSNLRDVDVFHLFSSRLKPRVAESPTVNYLELRNEPYYIVASIEVGNTTTKSILTATNMNTGKTYIVNKTIKMTRDVRSPKPGEEIFARTINGTPLTKDSIAELVRDTLIESHEKARLDIKTDLHFVVRSTGAVAGLDSPGQIGVFIQALAQGCLMAGVPPRMGWPQKKLVVVHSSSAPKVDLRVLELQAAKEVGSMSKSDLARRLQIRQAELDLILQELEHVGKVKLSEAKGKLVVGLRDVTS